MKAGTCEPVQGATVDVRHTNAAPTVLSTARMADGVLQAWRTLAIQ